MKLRNLFAGAMVMAAAIFSGCEPEEQLGLPDVVLGATDLEFTQGAGSQEIKVTATREWKVEYNAEWIAVTPDKGQGSNNEQTLTVTVTENTGANRTAKVTVTIGMVQKAFNVNQAGPGGATDGVEALTVKAFIEKADTENYYRLTGKVSGFNSQYCSFDITDETGKIYVYSVTDESKAEWSSKIKDGGTVVLQGKYLYYEKNSKHEVVDAIIESFTTGSTDGGNDEPVDAVYHNNYDKAAAEEGEKGWPYLDQFEGWKNQAGSGAEGVSYSFKGMSARNNSHSNGTYSDYDGSGVNNMFFGKEAYFATHNIALGSAVNFTLSFGTEKYDGNNKTAKFDPAEFHVWLSSDGVKWVELEYTFAGTAAGRWNVASADFTVPAGTAKLSVCMVADKASVYRMDDMKLVATDKAGAVIDFSTGVSKDFGAPDNSDGDTEDEGTDDGNTGGGVEALTVKEFIEKADTENYFRLTGKVSGFNATYCSFDLTDETGKIYVYSVTDESKAEWSSKIKNGGTVVIQGKYLYYEQKSQHEVVDAIIESFTTGSTDGGNDAPADAVYHNNYDKAAAAEGEKGWPYLDQFEGWKNQAGSGAEGVSYSFKGVSARNNSHSNGDYSDYDGSGVNNIFFGKEAYFATHNIALGSAVNFTLSFGTEKYDGNNKTAKFDPAEFHVWLSSDGVKWVELEYTFAGTAAGRWNVASADFTVPAGTAKLSVCMVADKASVYRMDDMKLVATGKSGAVIDFSTGVSKDFGAPDNSGDNTGDDNTGDDNTGDDNTGGDNTGDDNTGGDNTGDDNTGGDNTGDDNTGDDNTGGDNGSDEPENPGNTPSNAKYVKVTENLTDWSGKYLIVFDNAAHATIDGKNLAATASNLTIAGGEIISTAAVDAAAVTVAKNGNVYSVRLPSGKYFGVRHNSSAEFDAPFDLEIEYVENDEEVGVQIRGEAHKEDKQSNPIQTYILYSNNGSYFRCYVAKNGQKGYSLPTLYKYVAE